MVAGVKISTGKSNWGHGTQWSLKTDWRELFQYLQRLEKEMPQVLGETLKQLADEGIARQQARLKRIANNRGPSKSFHTSRGNVREVYYEWVSKQKAETKIANSLRSRFVGNKNSGQQRISVFSDPYPQGVLGNRGGKIAQYFEDGTGKFFTGRNRHGKGGFVHDGFPALRYMEGIGFNISENFIERFSLKAESQLRPGGRGA
jgi:hypothetical protein